MKIYAIAGTFFMAGATPTIVHAAEQAGGTHVELEPHAMSHALKLL